MRRYADNQNALVHKLQQSSCPVNHEVSPARALLCWVDPVDVPRRIRLIVDQVDHVAVSRRHVVSVRREEAQQASERRVASFAGTNTFDILQRELRPVIGRCNRLI